MAIVLDTDALSGAGGRLVPVGTCLFTYAAGAPSGYLIRDGSLIPVALYPALFAVLGYTYGGAGALFGLPDDRGLALAGSGLGTALPGLTNHALGVVFGEESHVQLVGELAQHTHLQNAHTHVQDAHNHVQDAHNHTQDAHNHIQDAHTHTQNAHTHTQNAHTHTQNTHTHPVGNGLNTQLHGPDGVATGGAVPGIYGSSIAAGIPVSARDATATNQNATATNQTATATNQNTTATNQSAVATNQATTATNQATTATNQNTTAVNLDEGASDPMNVIQPTRYLTPIIAY